MKLSHFLLSAIAVTTLVGCGNLSKVSKEGTPVEGTELVWPKIEKSKFNHDGTQLGSWPNWDNVRMIDRGMNKDLILAKAYLLFVNGIMYFTIVKTVSIKSANTRSYLTKTWMPKASSGIQTAVTATPHFL